ncbi:ABC transporter ATP-binding protein [Actinacidiphila sp. DG2A-62]|uniref:ABC transporter ATP-binding protein n=1 Tax=Actinacidiphila sp. DG2A-62 TaxID=3108821 RepID=UPI002DB979C6|nr:ABC transporter ATP-binding protein [Actinacidiphila sp. DG2A-62]MEC3996844.1 ABC transporter ATP-binding protein [Actinacidiphila sp. DG2A-62]
MTTPEESRGEVREPAAQSAAEAAAGAAESVAGRTAVSAAGQAAGAAEAAAGAAESAAGHLVEVADLRIEFPTESGPVTAVAGLGFTLAPGAALGLVGESGSGKSATAYALLGLHRGTGAKVTGTVRVAGTDVLGASDAELRRLRGGTAAMVFQDPLSSLDPYQAIGDQIAEVHRVHHRVSRSAARARAVRVLDRVGIADAARRARSRPHEFSGGMRQRALIAIALACEPRLIVADEPTTALDVTVQAQILDLLHELRAEEGVGLLLVTHDLGVAAGSVDELLVLRDGAPVERGPLARVLAAPAADYTRALLTAVPRLDAGPTGRTGADAASAGRAGGDAGAEVREPVGAANTSAEVRESAGAADTSAEVRDPVGAAGGGGGSRGDELLVVSGLSREFGPARHRVHAVRDVDLTLREGETLGVVGESGSGKTTLGRMLVRLLDPSAGRILYRGRDIAPLGDRALRPLRRELQMVFQDPVSSLNPRRSIGESIADPLRAAGALTDKEIRARVRELLERVGLDPDWYRRYPHEFSGGQRQRVGIARALAPAPKLVVCDEPVSALDVTTQAQVVALLGELQRDLGLSLIFIAHDLAVVRQVSDRVAVMRGGRIVETGTAAEVYDAPQDPYTTSLLAAVPVLDPAEAAARRTGRAELRKATAAAP